MTAALDLWDLFVNQVFGGFGIAVVGLLILLFTIVGVIGKISSYTTTWFLILFLLAMSLGYGLVIFSLLITLALIVALMFSWKGYMEKA